LEHQNFTFFFVQLSLHPQELRVVLVRAKTSGLFFVFHNIELLLHSFVLQQKNLHIVTTQLLAAPLLRAPIPRQLRGELLNVFAERFNGLILLALLPLDISDVILEPSYLYVFLSAGIVHLRQLLFVKFHSFLQVLILLLYKHLVTRDIFIIQIGLQSLREFGFKIWDLRQPRLIDL